MQVIKPVQGGDCILNVLNEEQRLLLDHAINSIDIKPLMQHFQGCRDTCEVLQQQAWPVGRISSLTVKL